MGCFMNILWLMFGGIITAVEYLIASLLMMFTIIGIPFGMQTLKMASLALWPFGKEVRSGERSNGCLYVLMNILWIFLGGIWICLSHLGFGLLLCITIIGLLNRIIIDDVLLDDQDEQEMLKVTRLSAKFDIMPFFKGKISISSVQLFGFNINLQKKTPDSPPNFKFVLDAFASNDTVKKDNSLDLRINSILIRRGRMAYHVLSEEETPGKFNAKHIHLQNIIANISLKALSKDSINLGIKRLSLDEKVSGFSLKKMSLKLVANSRQTSIDNFAIELPETSLKLDTIHLIYDSLKAFE